MKPAQTLLDERLRALSDPTRRSILQLIGRRETSANDIAARFDTARPTISRHLKTLESAKLVTVRRQGTSRFYHANHSGLRDMAIWFETFWDEGLPRLKSLIERESGDK